MTFTAIGNSVRRRMLTALSDSGEVRSKSLMEEMEIEKTSWYYHLRKLEEAGVVTLEKRERDYYIKIDKAKLRAEIAELAVELGL